MERRRFLALSAGCTAANSFVFKAMAHIELDLSTLSEQASSMEQQLGDLLSRVEQTYTQQEQTEEEASAPEPVEEDRLTAADQTRIDRLFEQAGSDRSKAFELKQELDRLGVFKEYEDRFLDLFKRM